MEETPKDESESIHQVLEDLGLNQWLVEKITPEKAKELEKEEISDNKDIPRSFFWNIFNPCYEDRPVFLLNGESPACPEEICEDFCFHIEDDYEDDYEENEPYSHFDVTVAVSLCCSNSCKELLAEKLNECEISVPFTLPDIVDRDINVIQSYMVKGLVGEKRYEQPVPIVSFLCVNGLPIRKTKLLNSIFVPVATKPFFDSQEERGDDDEQGKKSLFVNGLIDAIISSPGKCICRRNGICKCSFKKEILFLNLYGLCTDHRDQEELLCKLSTLVVLFVDSGTLQKDDELIQDIINIVEKSQKVAIVLTKTKEALFETCKEGVERLKEILIGKHVEVIIFYNPGTGLIDNYDFMRGHMKMKINAIMDTLDCQESLKERIENIAVKNFIIDK